MSKLFRKAFRIESSGKIVYNKYTFVTLSILLILSVILVYYNLVFVPSRDIIMEKIRKEFTSKLAMKSMLFDNAVSQYVQGVISLGDRAFVKDEIEEFLNGELDFEVMIGLGTPKFEDGANTLVNLAHAYRIIDNVIVLDYGDSLKISDKDVINIYRKYTDITDFVIHDTLDYTYVIYPLKKNGKYLAYDIAFFDNSQIIKEITTENTDFELIYNLDCECANIIKKSNTSLLNGIIEVCNDEVVFIYKSHYADLYYKFSTQLDLFYKEFSFFYRNHIVTVSILILAIVSMLIAIYRKEKLQYLEKVMEQDKKYKWMIENSSDSILMRRDGKFLYANTALFNLLGYERDELNAENFEQVFTDEEYKRIIPIIEGNRLQNKTKYRYEITMLKKDGSEIHVEVSESLVELNNGKTYFSILRDITRQHEMIDLLKKLEQDALQSSEEFVSICANCHLIQDKKTEGKPWVNMEQYLTEKYDIQFSHSICPDCIKELYPELKGKD